MRVSAIQVAYGASWSRLVLPSVRSNLHAACDICVYIQASDNVCKEHARMLLYVCKEHACMHACMHAPILGLLSYIGLAFVYAFDCIYNDNLCLMLQRAVSTHQPTPVCGSI